MVATVLGNSTTASTVTHELAVPRVKILLVDDDPHSLASMTAMLEVLSEEVLTAISADQALKHLLRNDFAVIVLDVVMPDVNGFELASVIRQRERFRHTPIIFLSGLWKEDHQMLRGYRLGAVDYLLKPCDPELLRFKIKTFVDLAKQSELRRRYAELIERKNIELEENSHKLNQAVADTLQAYDKLEREMAERKQAEASRDRLAGKLGATPDFVEAMAEGAVTLASDQTILYCNSQMAAMLGCSAEKVVGLPMTSFIEPSGQVTFAALFEEALRGSVKTELNLIPKSGEAVPVQLALNSFRGSGLQAIAMVITDLRDQKRNEEMLAQGRLARLILENAMSGIAVCDTGGRITLASSALSELCDGTPLFKHFDELFALRFSDGRSFSVADILSGTRYKSAEVGFQRHAGRTFSLLINAGPILTDRDGNQETLGCVITMVDISERKQAEQALRRSEQLVAAIRIAAELSHEVNNPLAGITNALFLLQKNAPLEPPFREWLDAACAETDRVSQIVKKTLSFSRASTAPPAPFVLAETVDKLLEAFASSISAKRLVVKKRYDYKGTVEGNQEEIRQALGNLVANAIDALGEGGQLTIHLYRGREWTNSERKGVRIAVADQGSGIGKEHSPRLFEPFFTTKGEKGGGLGLWVTEGIVHKHRGFIRLRSSTREGRSGTVASVFLPAELESHNVAGHV